MTKQNDELLIVGDLAERLGVRYSTIKYYSQLGLIPFTTPEGKKYKYYKIDEVKPRLADIERLKNKGYKVADIVKLYANEGKLASNVDITLLNLTAIKTCKGGK